MSQLAALTEQEIELISELLARLEEEQEALKNADATALPALSEQKLKVIERLNTLESARAKVLGCQAGTDVRTAMEAWLAKHPEQQQLLGNWKKLLDLARQAKQLHIQNGQLISMHLQQTNEMLATLTSPAQQNTLYGSDGQASPTSGSRIVDSA
ncbi:MAG: flagellar protein FlgN [Azonexus sp.]